jgi:hypothetical protein
MQIMKKEKGSKEEALTLAATRNSAQPAAYPASDLQFLGFPPSRATSCLAPQLRGGGGNLQQRILLQLRVPKTSKEPGGKNVGKVKSNLLLVRFF